MRSQPSHFVFEEQFVWKSCEYRWGNLTSFVFHLHFKEKHEVRCLNLKSFGPQQSTETNNTQMEAIYLFQSPSLKASESQKSSVKASQRIQNML